MWPSHSSGTSALVVILRGRWTFFCPPVDFQNSPGCLGLCSALVLVQVHWCRAWIWSATSRYHSWPLYWSGPPCVCVSTASHTLQSGRKDFQWTFSIRSFFHISIFFLTGSLWSSRPKRRGMCQVLRTRAL